ncbi:hypothetical protein AB0M37_24805 [Micromonospora chalcea]
MSAQHLLRALGWPPHRRLDVQPRHGMLVVCSASYTAAMHDDRDTAWTLLGEAETAARHAGDYGTAVDYARQVDPARIVMPERRARYRGDTALALHGRRRPQATFQALLAAERDTPQEVRYRPWAQQLSRLLLLRVGRFRSGGDCRVGTVHPYRPLLMRNDVVAERYRLTVSPPPDGKIV